MPQDATGFVITSVKRPRLEDIECIKLDKIYLYCTWNVQYGGVHMN